MKSEIPLPPPPKKKETNGSRLAGGRFNKETYKQGLSWATQVESRNRPARILTAYRETFSVFSQVYRADGLSNTLLSLKAALLKTAPSEGMGGGTYIPRTEEEVRSFWLSGSSLHFN